MRGLAVLLATGLGVGRLPIAPATWASAFTAIPLFFLLPRLTRPEYLALTIGITILAIVVCGPAEKALGHDAHPIVLDEVAGMMVTMFAAPTSLPGPPYAMALLVGFVLFRIFDIWKPWPIREADHRLHGGFGIMLDDVIAGVFSAAILLVLTYVVKT